VSVVQLKPTHREVQPVKECLGCGCYLRSYGNTSYCDPCSSPESELDEAEVFSRIASIKDARRRCKAFEAYAELQERAAA
jgi:hypothetical protein